MREKQKQNKKQFPFTRFSAVFEKAFSGEIILKNSDDAFLDLNGLTEENIGKDITETLGKSEADLFDYYYSCYQGRKYYLNFVRNYPKQPDILWIVDAIIDLYTINLNGILLSRPENYLLDSFGQQNESERIMNSYFFACGRIKLTGNSAYFSDINDYLTILLNQNRISKTCILDSCIFRNCIQRKTSSVSMMRYSGNALSASFDGKSINAENCDRTMQYHYIAGVYPFIIDDEVREVQFFLIPFDSAGIMSEEVISQLTPRENTILRLSAEGLNLAQIAKALCISEHTAKTILYNSFRKIDVNTKTEAILKFYGLK